MLTPSGSNPWIYLNLALTLPLARLPRELIAQLPLRVPDLDVRSNRDHTPALTPVNSQLGRQTLFNRRDRTNAVA